MEIPKISILMSNYNHGHYLKESLGSLTKQTVFPFECIIIDDCSTDNSVEIIKKYQKDYNFIKLIQNSQNKGVIHNVAIGLNLSKGDYLMMFAADDTWSKDLIEKTTNLLIKYPNVGIVCSIPCYIYENGTEANAAVPQKKLPEYIPPTSLTSIFEKDLFIGGHTAAVKKKYLLEAKGMIDDLKWHCDWFAMHTIAFRHGLCFIPEKLGFQRLSPNSYSASFLIWKKQKKVLKNLFLIIQKKDFKDVKNKFFESKIIFLYPPFACIYLIFYPRHWFSLSLQTWKDIFHVFFFRDCLEKQHLYYRITKVILFIPYICIYFFFHPKFSSLKIWIKIKNQIAKKDFYHKVKSIIKKFIRKKT